MKYYLRKRRTTAASRAARVPGLILFLILTTFTGNIVRAEATACEEETPSVHCGNTPTAGFDNNGRLWAAFESDGHVYVTHSGDQSTQFSQPVRVNPEAETIYTNGENRPKIAFGTGGGIYVSWTRKIEGNYAGEIRFSRSLDGGRSFKPVRTINDDGLPISHRFESLHVSGNGDVYLIWLDKRDKVTTINRGGEYPGAATYYAVSTDNGKSFSTNHKLADTSCECCRIAVTDTPEGGAAVFWRQIFNSQTRDHAFAAIKRDDIVTPAQRATRDEWRINACPHHGPSMTTAGDGGYHLAWFTNSDTRKGIYYGYYRPDMEQPGRFLHVSGSAGSTHPYILKNGSQGTVILVWKQFDGKNTNIRMITSDDAGKNWTQSRIVAETGASSDHPLLIEHGNETFLTWHTEKEGFRIIPLAINKKMVKQ